MQLICYIKYGYRSEFTWEIFMIVALYQNNPVFGEIEKNIADVLDGIKERQFDLLVLPELFASGYRFRDKEEARELSEKAGEGSTFDRMSEIAREKNAAVIFGFPEREREQLFNSAAAVLPDGGHHVYRKVHLFDTEKEIFQPGDTGFKVFEFGKARIGMMICFDWRFPESARRLGLMGAQVIAHPSNLVLPFCPDAMIIRALENNVFAITADRTGRENRAGDTLHFIGRSRIISPAGEVLAELGQDECGYLEAKIEPADADNKKINSRNDLFADRRPEFY
jgi:predicted amidohydrolase